MNHPRIHSPLGARLVSATLLLGALLAIAPPPAPASASEGACTTGDGVTVVVDFTDLGGSIVVGCAPSDPGNGRAALAAAGFVATDSQPGLICAINAKPDPCPATFAGSYWSYWHSAPDGDWTSYEVGADSSDPTPGEIEGWRYNDGSAGPGIAPTDAASRLPQAVPTTTASEVYRSPASHATDDVLLFTAVGLAAAVLLLSAFFVVRARNRRTSEDHQN